MSTRNNLLGRVIKRKIDRAASEDDVKGIIDNANTQLLQRQEVKETHVWPYKWWSELVLT